MSSNYLVWVKICVNIAKQQREYGYNKFDKGSHIIDKDLEWESAHDLSDHGASLYHSPSAMTNIFC